MRRVSALPEGPQRERQGRYSEQTGKQVPEREQGQAQGFGLRAGSARAHAGPMRTSHFPAANLPSAVGTAAGRIPQPAGAPRAHPVLPYHRLARAHPSYRWWRPVLTLVVTAAAYCLLLIALVATATVASALDPVLGVLIDDAMVPSAALDMHDPVAALLALSMLAIGLPAALLGVRVGGWQPACSVSSVPGRLRWGLLARCLALAAVLYLVFDLVLLVSGTETFRRGAVWAPHSGWALTVALLVVPFQAAAEEYVFRGVLMQTIGSWLRHPAWAILLPAPLFVLGHEYGWVGQLDIVVFAVAAGWLTWRTGGLEAAIGLHVVGNCLAFGLGSIGLTDLNATDIPTFSVVPSAGLTLSYTVLVARGRTWWLTPPPSTAAPGAGPPVLRTAPPSRPHSARCDPSHVAPPHRSALPHPLAPVVGGEQQSCCDVALVERGRRRSPVQRFPCTPPSGHLPHPGSVAGAGSGSLS